MICQDCGRDFSDHASLRGHLMTEKCTGVNAPKTLSEADGGKPA
jgi:hypothetical protein